MSAAQSGPEALLVADLRGHLLERLGRAWIRNAPGAGSMLVCTEVTHPYTICRTGQRVGLIHWIDPLVFRQTAPAVTAPQVVMVHHLTQEEVAPMLARLPLADAVTTSSRRWKTRLESLTEREVVLVPYVVDAHTFRPVLDRRAVRRAFGIGEAEFVVGFVGKASADAFGRKGLDRLDRILDLAAREWPDLTVLLVGPGWEPLAEKIRARGTRAIHRQVSVTEETASLYPLMDVLLVTSTEEGGPCTLLEAMACAVPCVTSDVGHVPEVIQDGINGFVIPSGDPAGYLAVLKALRSGGDLPGRIGAAAREFVERERDERVVLPRVDFSGLYRAARAAYEARSARERFQRRVRQVPLAARYAARTVREGVKEIAPRRA